MIGNYFKVALRNLIRHKSFSLINLVGLAIGLACCIIIFLYLLSESGYDQYHQKRAQIYRLTLGVEGLSSGTIWHSATSSILWGPALKSDYPAVRDFCRVMEAREELTFVRGERRFVEGKIVYADQNIFSFFTWPFIQGDPQAALREPFAAVLTRSMAQKFFGGENPVGEIITVENKERDESGELITESRPVKITGVIEDIPYKSHLKPQIILSFRSLNEIMEADVTGGTHPDPWYWRGRLVHNYLLLPQGYPPEQLTAKFPAFLDKYVGDATVSRGYTYHPYLQPLSGIHLEGAVYGTFERGGDREQLYLFGIIALFVLLIACINFMNLSTARSASRAKEVGIRKVVGAPRRRLIGQFLGESLLMSLLALLLALLLVEFLNPIFYHYIDREFYFARSDYYLAVSVIMGITFLAGLVAGSYPAFFLSRFRPVKVLKANKPGATRGGGLRKALVVLQFAVTIFFILGTLTLYWQLRYMQEQELGFKRDQIVVLPPDVLNPILGQLDAHKNELLARSNIRRVTLSSAIPGRSYGGDVWAEAGKAGEEGFGLAEFAVDYDFLELYGLELIAGRGFNEEMGTDAAPAELQPEESGYEIAAIVNQEAVRRFGWGSVDKALGRRIVRDPVSNDFTGRIIGVVKDFHFESLHEPIEPMVFFINPHYARSHRFLSIEIAAGQIPPAIEQLREKFTAIATETPFEYFFVDENFAQLYEEDQKLLEIYGIISLFTIFIASLGLFGLASYTAEQRTKEIGIRKVLGASVLGIVILLSRDFLKLILVGFAIIVPVGYWVLGSWLENFAYRIDLSGWLFALAGGVALLIALITVSGQAIKAALANPAKSLRYE